MRDTPAELNDHLFTQMMAKSGVERLAIGCQMADAARKLVWSGISKDLDAQARRRKFLERFYGKSFLKTEL